VLIRGGARVPWWSVPPYLHLAFAFPPRSILHDYRNRLSRHEDETHPTRTERT